METSTEKPADFVVGDAVKVTIPFSFTVRERTFAGAPSSLKRSVNPGAIGRIVKVMPDGYKIRFNGYNGPIPGIVFKPDCLVPYTKLVPGEYHADEAGRPVDDDYT